jgi:hypothetical protein
MPCAAGRQLPPEGARATTISERLAVAWRYPSLARGAEAAEIRGIRYCLLRDSPRNLSLPQMALALAFRAMVA